MKINVRHFESKIRLIVYPALWSALADDLAGAIQKSMGSTSASAYATILAKGVNLYFLSASSEANTIAQAPSLILLELAAVTEPFFANTGFKSGIFSF